MIQTFQMVSSEKANQYKCHFLLSLDKNTKISLPACLLENLNSKKLMGVTIKRKLNFDEHVTNRCDKVQKIFPYKP